MNSKIKLTTKLYGFSILCGCFCFSMFINANKDYTKTVVKGTMIEGTSPMIEKVNLQNPVYYTVFSNVLNS